MPAVSPREHAAPPPPLSLPSSRAATMYAAKSRGSLGATKGATSGSALRRCYTLTVVAMVLLG